MNTIELTWADTLERIDPTARAYFENTGFTLIASKEG
jgi:hypothetical protein